MLRSVKIDPGSSSSCGLDAAPHRMGRRVLNDGSYARSRASLEDGYKPPSLGRSDRRRVPLENFTFGYIQAVGFVYIKAQTFKTPLALAPAADGKEKPRATPGGRDTDCRGTRGRSKKHRVTAMRVQLVSAPARARLREARW